MHALMQVLMSLTVPRRAGTTTRCQDPDCRLPSCGGNRLEIMDDTWADPLGVSFILPGDKVYNPKMLQVANGLEIPANKIKVVVMHHKTEG